jgi:hypothetical protein
MARAISVPRVVAPGMSWILNRPKQFRKCIITLLPRKCKRLCPARGDYFGGRSFCGRPRVYASARAGSPISRGQAFEGLTRAGWPRIFRIQRWPAGSVSISVEIENPAGSSPEGVQQRHGLALAHAQVRRSRPFGARSDASEPLSNPTKRATHQIRGVWGR